MRESKVDSVAEPPHITKTAVSQTRTLMRVISPPSERKLNQQLFFGTD